MHILVIHLKKIKLILHYNKLENSESELQYIHYTSKNIIYKIYIFKYSRVLIKSIRKINI